MAASVFACFNSRCFRLDGAVSFLQKKRALRIWFLYLKEDDTVL
jgi:hypothetical protein